MDQDPNKYSESTERKLTPPPKGNGNGRGIFAALIAIAVAIAKYKMVIVALKWIIVSLKVVALFAKAAVAAVVVAGTVLAPLNYIDNTLERISAFGRASIVFVTELAPLAGHGKSIDQALLIAN
ncbi:MAG: hypothetical protein ACLPN5_03890 [Roseiarcus sp.]